MSPSRRASSRHVSAPAAPDPSTSKTIAIFSDRLAVLPCLLRAAFRSVAMPGERHDGSRVAHAGSAQDLTGAQNGNRRRPADGTEGCWKAEANSSDREDQQQGSQRSTAN